MVRSGDRRIAHRRVPRRDGLLQENRPGRQDNRHRATRADPEGGHAPAQAGGGAHTGGQSPGHGGLRRDGGAKCPAGAPPGGRFDPAVITQPAEERSTPTRHGRLRARKEALQMGTFNSSKTFPYTVEDLAPVARDVMDHFEGQDFEVVETNIPTGGVQVSIRKGGTFKAIIGMKTALNIKMVPVANGTTVDAGVGIFGQQAIPTAITLLVFWPVIIVQVWNMAQESNLDDEALRVAEESLKAHSSKAPSEASAE